MKDTNLQARIEQHLAAHARYLNDREVRILQGNGFTFDDKDGYRVLRDALVSPSWRTGGLTGGSCWGSKADTPVQADETPPWLEEFFEEVAPEISFLKFRRLQEKCTRHEYGQGEYYGNYTSYAFQVLKLQDIFEVLDA